MMNIYINGRFVTQKITGVQRYAYELLRALDEGIEKGAVDAGIFKFHLLTPHGQKQNIDLKIIEKKQVGHLKGQLWEQIELPLYARGGFLVNLCNQGPIFKRKQIVTIHDAAIYRFPKAYSWLFRTWYKLTWYCLSKTAKLILTVSEFSRQELINRGVGSEDKIRVIPNGINHIHRAMSNKGVLDKYSLEKNGYIFAVGSLNPTKNFSALLAAFERLDNKNLKLAIAGGGNEKIFSKTGFAVPANVKFLGYVDDADLKCLYENAAFFVFPSIYEGFGIPPLEAMACGCPVITSKVASLPEICQNAALYCDPFNIQDVADKMNLMASDKDLRLSFAERGLARSMFFQWDDSVRLLLEVIKK